MGTRSIVAVIDGGQEVATIYRQFDGYPTGMGADLKSFAGEMAIVNGYGTDTPECAANGMGCFAAQLIGHLKDKIGNVYLYTSGKREVGEEFIYTLSEQAGRVWLNLVAGGVTAFGYPGTPPEDMRPLYNGLLADFDPENVEE